MSLSSLDYETIAAAAVIMLAYAYAAFWALNIRRKLRVELYRHQALGIGLVAICVAYFTWTLDGLLGLAPASLGEPPLSTIGFFSFLACTAPLLYWTDSSLLAVRDSDPLQRDVLGWSRIRIVLWGAMAICLVGGGAYLVYESIFLSSQVITSQYLSGIPPILSDIAGFVPLVVPLAVTIIFLPVAARRTKDLTLRRHLKWFGLGAVFLASGISGDVAEALTGGTAAIVNSFVDPIIFLVFFGISAYCFYRSARAVIPIYSFEGGAS